MLESDKQVPSYPVDNFSELGQPGDPASNFSAIVVPSARGASYLTNAANTAQAGSVPLVVLCSGRTDHVAAAELFSQYNQDLHHKQPRLIWHAVKLPDDYENPLFNFRAQYSIPEDFICPGDLSLKRTIGACVAERVFYMDDDMEVSHEALALAGSLLAANAIVGLRTGGMPDWSVIHHAREAAARFIQSQHYVLGSDNVTGNSMGINTALCSFYSPLNIYNEDWLLMHYALRDGRSGVAIAPGRASQAQYDPFSDPDRPRREEFGDTIIEGIYALPSRQRTVEVLGDETYWRSVISRRRGFAAKLLNIFNLPIEKIHMSYLGFNESTEDPVRDRRAQYAAVEAALEKILAYSAMVAPGNCTDYLRALDDDQRQWMERWDIFKEKRTPDILKNLGLLGLGEYTLSSEQD
ncbi:hypothetical protein JNM87_00400 [Candidatus Saccharibacteria bacterium]|nr:hypothetical protein [Candidatus Saccharibacteria bacterium]